MDKRTRPASLDALPACLSVRDVASALGISRGNAYEVIKADGFPRVVLGKRIIIPKDAFTAWLQAQIITNGR